MTAPSESNVVLQVADNVGRITLNRADRHNAFDDEVITELTEILDRVAADPGVKIVVLAANGKSFSAGADLGWMKRTAAYSVADNEADALVLAEMLSKLDTLAKPTVALVQGGAYGGGVGLVAACDMAIAADNAVFYFALRSGGHGVTCRAALFSHRGAVRCRRGASAGSGP
jgi:methylglutaconyl-CoA hydratase